STRSTWLAPKQANRNANATTNQRQNSERVITLDFLRAVWSSLGVAVVFGLQVPENYSQGSWSRLGFVPFYRISLSTSVCTTRQGWITDPRAVFTGMVHTTERVGDLSRWEVLSEMQARMIH